MATQDLGFNVFALDKASRTFIRLADRIERVSDKLDELDRKRANPKIDLDVDESKVRKAVNTFADAADDEAERRRGGFFRTMFTPNRGIVMALRTGIPAVLGSPIGAAALALGGVFAASFVAAVLSSGVFALIAGGFTAIAAVALAENEKIATAFADTSARIKNSLTGAAAPLIPAFTQALGIMPDLFARHIRQPLEDIFEGLGPTIVPFVESAAQTIGNILGSLATPRFLTGMQTVLASIANELPRLGDAVGGFFLKLADNADDTAEAFSNVITVTNGLIGVFSELTVVLTDVFNRFGDVGRLLSDVTDPTTELARSLGLAKEETGALEFAGGQLLSMFDMFTLNLRTVIPEMLGWTDSTEEGGKAAGRAAEKIEAEAEAAAAAAEKLEDLQSQHDALSDSADAAREQLDALEESLFGAGEAAINAEQAAINYEQAIDNVTESVKDNGKTTDINTQAGRDNKDNLLDLVNAGKEWLQSLRDNGAGTDELTEKTGLVREQFIKAARQMGINQEEAEELADDYGLIPSEVKTHLEAIDKATKKVNALEERLRKLEAKVRFAEFSAKTDNNALNRVAAQLNAAARSRNVVFNPVVSSRALSSARHQLVAHDGGMITPMGIRRLHDGGTLRPDERIVIGQTGERILNRRETAAYNAGAASGGGTRMVVEFDFRNASDSQFATWFEGMVRKGRVRVS